MYVMFSKSWILFILACGYTVAIGKCPLYGKIKIPNTTIVTLRFSILLGCSAGADLSVTMYFFRIGSSVFLQLSRAVLS